MNTMKYFLAGVLSALTFSAAQAQLTIEITGAGAEQLAIAIAPFDGMDNPKNAEVVETIKSDLTRSGLFRLVKFERAGLNEESLPDYESFKSGGVDALVVGRLATAPDGRIEARFRLHDVASASPIAGKALITTPEQSRLLGHHIADEIYEKLTGEKGIFSTRIAYIVKTGAQYRLQIADSDGQNTVSALVSTEPIISPTFSPDGQHIAYVSFEKKKPVIYTHNLHSGTRSILANFKGSNSAPAYSPDGSRLAIVLSKDGNSQIYTVNAKGGDLVRMTNSRGIATEPHFSADGAWIYFTSDRGGNPQIYKMPSSGGAASRVTFEGNYNVSPRPSPDGKSLAFITRRNGQFQLAVLDLTTNQVQILNNSGKDESPAFAPNNRLILFASVENGRGVLNVVSADGKTKQRLSAPAGEIREPSWGPLR